MKDGTTAGDSVVACGLRGSRQAVPSQNVSPLRPSSLVLHSSGFTLIELLVVIIIIGILIGIITGAVQSVVRDRKIAQAKSEVQAIAVAAEDYYRVFREIPVSTNWYLPSDADGGDAIYTQGLDNATMPPVSGSPYSDMRRSGNPALAAEFYNRLMGSNEQSKVFLKIHRTDITVTPSGNSSNGVLLDPWKVPYSFYLDSNYNGAPYGLFSKDCTSFILSRGPNKKPDPFNRVVSDDITWPPLDIIW